MGMRGAMRCLLFLEDDLTKPRWRVEFEKVRDNFPAFRFRGNASAGEVTAVEGSIQNQGRGYGIRIEIPDTYPYTIPRILPSGWNPQNCPHIYGDGSLCVMMSHEWSEHYSIAYLIAKAAVWIGKWAKWKETGTWPGADMHKGI